MTTFNENGVRVDRIDDLIAQIKEYGSVCMTAWQTFAGGDAFARTIEQLHPCGNQACIGGHLALNKMFREAGGGMSTDGDPRYFGHAENAFSAYMGGSWQAAHVLIFGCGAECGAGGGVANWVDWDANDAVRALELYKTIPPNAAENYCLNVFSQVRGDADAS